MEDVVNQSRSNLTPEQSLKKLYEYAYIQDARQRSYHLRLYRSHLAVFGTICAVGVFYVGYNMFDGVWANLSTTNQVTNLIRIYVNPARAVYRPEIYYRDQNAAEILAQQQPEKTNPLKLWH